MSNLQSQSPIGDPVLTTRGLSVHYGNRPALDDITITIHAGEVIGLLGPNGAGKSTLLKVLAGMVPPSHGACAFHAREITGATPGITYVPQRAGADWTFPISVIDVVLLGLSPATPRFRPFGGGERRQALEALRHVEMERYANIQIGALSGGQQQRVFLARALLSGGSVLLLDEPFTGIDIPTQTLFVSLFDDLKAKGAAIVYATHDLDQARRAADRVILINRGLIAAGDPAEIFRGSKIHEAFGGKVLVIDAGESTPLAVAGAAREDH